MLLLRTSKCQVTIHIQLQPGILEILDVVLNAMRHDSDAFAAPNLAVAKSSNLIHKPYNNYIITFPCFQKWLSFQLVYVLIFMVCEYHPFFKIISLAVDICYINMYIIKKKL